MQLFALGVPWTEKIVSSEKLFQEAVSASKQIIYLWLVVSSPFRLQPDDDCFIFFGVAQPPSQHPYLIQCGEPNNEILVENGF